jgi:hypothetical protein
MDGEEGMTTVIVLIGEQGRTTVAMLDGVEGMTPYKKIKYLNHGSESILWQA